MSVMEKKGFEGANLLLDQVRGYLDGVEDDGSRCDVVLECFESEEGLKDILVKIRKVT